MTDDITAEHITIIHNQWFLAECWARILASRSPCERARKGRVLQQKLLDPASLPPVKGINIPEFETTWSFRWAAFLSYCLPSGKTHRTQKWCQKYKLGYLAVKISSKKTVSKSCTARHAKKPMRSRPWGFAKPGPGRGVGPDPPSLCRRGRLGGRPGCFTHKWHQNFQQNHFFMCFDRKESLEKKTSWFLPWSFSSAFS